VVPGIDRGVAVNRTPFEVSAAHRARWLAELAEALEEARALVKQLGAMEGRIEAAELFARIEAIGFEVEVIRLAAKTAAATRSDPEWSKSLPWQRRA
jgi:acyl-CoA reductase-like NAD-dependent aldehyde dehydrogenase